MITFDITFDDGHTKTVTFDRSRIKLKALRLLDSVGAATEWSRVIPAIAALLGLSEAEADEIELGQWEQIAGAMRQPAPDLAVPNASGPPSA